MWRARTASSSPAATASRWNVPEASSQRTEAIEAIEAGAGVFGRFYCGSARDYCVHPTGLVMKASNERKHQHQTACVVVSLVAGVLVGHVSSDWTAYTSSGPSTASAGISWSALQGIANSCEEFYSPPFEVFKACMQRLCLVITMKSTPQRRV